MPKEHSEWETALGFVSKIIGWLHTWLSLVYNNLYWESLCWELNAKSLIRQIHSGEVHESYLGQQVRTSTYCYIHTVLSESEYFLPRNVFRCTDKGNSSGHHAKELGGKHRHWQLEEYMTASLRNWGTKLLENTLAVTLISQQDQSQKFLIGTSSYISDWSYSFTVKLYVHAKVLPIRPK